MKDLPIRYRDTRRVDLHVRMPLELYVIQRDQYVSNIQRSLLLNMLLDSGSKLFLASSGNQAVFVPLLK